MIAVAATLTILWVVLLAVVVLGAVGFFALIAWDLIASREPRTEVATEPVFAGTAQTV
jgi:flagellar basal body-associated protein FliL